MNLKEQLYITTIADCRNITRAAKRLHISQPALSAYVAHLEEQLCVRLFDRQAKDLVPTYPGELYIHAAKRMLRTKAEFDEMLSDLREDYKGRLRIGMQIRRSPLIIPDFFKTFGEAYPKVDISFAEGVMEYLEAMLENNELDLVLCNKTHASKGFEYIKIADEKLLLATSPNDPRIALARPIKGSPRRWIDLRLFAGETFILQRTRQSQRNFSDALMKRLKVSPSRVIEVQNIETSTRLAALGAGVSFVLDTYAKHFKFRPQPAYFSVGDEPFLVEFVAVRRKESYMPAYVEAAIEIIQSIF